MGWLVITHRKGFCCIAEPGLSVVVTTCARREVQRILMELLNQMDGFDQNVNVKVRARQGWPCFSKSLSCFLLLDNSSTLLRWLYLTSLLLNSAVAVRGRLEEECE